jgi:hypothetical protein
MSETLITDGRGRIHRSNGSTAYACASPAHLVCSHLQINRRSRSLASFSVGNNAGTGVGSRRSRRSSRCVTSLGLIWMLSRLRVYADLLPPVRTRDLAHGRTKTLRIVICARAHGIFTRLLKIQFPAIMSRINAAAPTKFSSMRWRWLSSCWVAALLFPEYTSCDFSVLFELGKA